MSKRHLILASIWVLPLLVWFEVGLAGTTVDTAWVRRYNDPRSWVDEAWALALDDSGNVYVTGFSYDSTMDADYLTIKYNSDGDKVWTSRYNGTSDSNDVAFAIAADHSGNVLVSGYSFGSGTYEDYATVKYDPDGHELWVERYNGPGNFTDQAVAMEVDGAGNVYLTGVSYGDGTSGDYATIKYDAGGDIVWLRRYDGPASGWDEALAITVDDIGNVYVTGGSRGVGTSSDFATIKYDPAGDTLWVRRYNGVADGWDFGHAITLDDFNNVYVNGWSGSHPNSDYATIKYDSNGNELWVGIYNGPGSENDYSNDIAVDDYGNVYVTGRSWGEGTQYDYATVKYTADGTEEWARRYNGPGNAEDIACGIALDGAGNVYVTGNASGSGTYDDYVTIRYSPDGDQIWVTAYDGPGNYYDVPQALKVSNSGDIYVTGRSSGNYWDYATIKYSQSFSRGDVDGNGSIDIGDIIYLLNYLYRGGSPPEPQETGDCNCTGFIDIGDVVYLINYLFRSGPPPCEG